MRLWKPKRTSRQDEASLGRIRDIRASKPQSSKFLRNKAGRAVLTGTLQQERIKAYQAHNQSHARFLATVSERNQALFPSIVTTADRWLVAEWVDGKEVSDPVHACVDVLNAVQAMPLNGLPEPGFDYVRDFIVPRFEEAAALAGVQQDHQAQVHALVSRTAPLRMSHPDVTPANIIERNGSRILIDNELLSVGRFPLLDACNCARSLRERDRKTFWDTWLADHPVGEDEQKLTALAWLFREIGSAFITKKFMRCEALLDRLARAPDTGLNELSFPVRG